jgi:pyruvate, orthophosphate dikinase
VYSVESETNRNDVTMGQQSSRWIVWIDGSELPDMSLIGGKAWSIARMMSLGLPVPPAFAITTAACKAFLQDRALPPGLDEEIQQGMAHLEACTGRRFGGGERPLLVSVRSGAPVSMPGMMDTVLNLGITPQTETALAAECGDPRFAHDVHRRFLDLYTQVVLKAGPLQLERNGDAATWDRQITIATGSPLPENAHDRLLAAVRAVFESWNSRRARRYREHHGISNDLGTAVTVQAMVFGNLDDLSGTGVLFSRNPLSGDAEPFGQYLGRAQGEDVVSGKFTPDTLASMKKAVPEAHAALMGCSAILEKENGDAQDIEFTVQSGKLYLLQSRAAKRAPAAAVRIAVDMAREGLISKESALRRVTPEQIRSLLAPRLANGTADRAKVLATGEAACPGVGRGVVVTNSDEAELRSRSGEAVILARPTTSPEDVHGMLAAKAVITGIGGSTSHAAVVSRALGVPCVVGCGAATVEQLASMAVTVEGTLGKVFDGALDVEMPDDSKDAALSLLGEWARERSPITIYRPCDAPAGRIVDLATVKGGEDPEQLAELIRGYEGARGGAIASEGGVRAALRERLSFIVGEPVLALLVAAIHATGSERDKTRIAETVDR